jgi:hypothetical protein
LYQAHLLEKLQEAVQLFQEESASCWLRSKEHQLMWLGSSHSPDRVEYDKAKSNGKNHKKLVF